MANETTVTKYQNRLRRVLAHIDQHLLDDLSVEELSQVAHFSKFHFHRQFSASMGMGVYKYVQWRRLKKAAHELAYRSRYSVTDIALNTGFDSLEAFSRAFKKACGQTPSQFRRQPRWEPWRDHDEFLFKARADIMQTDNSNYSVNLLEQEAIPVAALEHHGAPERLGESIRRFIEWRKANKRPPSVSATYNILHNDPESTSAEAFRMDLCAGVNSAVEENPYGVIAKTIPAGRYAVLRHIGPDAGMRAAFHFLYGEWLPGSGETLRDAPCFLQRVTMYPDVPEHEAIIDIYLPLV
ncbi:GyrI-like domain-containing protein [Hahella sp. HN01]|uniref:AraC family transcriptional regulator n=1 Tax=Hahella sp. HN01 TaxID=2847262 RepID=UPI001C1EA890|nr:AraC family transcriptional regulator [Hahella sp. HN01]MBU6954046.1 AraC family transcriptional regulator [Hahella sp. HN01]